MNKNIANIANLNLVNIAMEKLTSRPEGLPGLGVYYGPSGYGKTTTTVAIVNHTNSYYVQMRSAWSKKVLLEKVLFEMGIKATGTISTYLDMICEQLAASQRPLIIDEADYAASKPGFVELLRDIYEGSQAPLLLVGEEMLPVKLKKYERFHGRVLSWIPAQPVSLADAEKLAAVYAPDVTIHKELLNHIVQQAHGSVRRVCVNLVNLQEFALLNGLDELNQENTKTCTLYTGEAPRRVA